MAKPSIQQKQHATVAAFGIDAWRTKLDASALEFTSAGQHMLELMLEARGKIELDTGREALQHAFGAAYAATYNVSFEEAVKAKSVQNRVSDGMAILKAEVLPASLPGNIQRAADACRKANPGKPRVARQPKNKDAGTNADASTTPLALLSQALEALRNEAGDNQTALSLIGDLVDMAAELAAELEAQHEALATA